MIANSATQLVYNIVAQVSHYCPSFISIAVERAMKILNYSPVIMFITAAAAAVDVISVAVVLFSESMGAAVLLQHFYIIYILASLIDYINMDR